MAKAIITITNCIGNKLEFPAKTDRIEIADTATMNIVDAKKYAFEWAHKNGRKVARVEYKIVYGRDGQEG